MKKLSGYLTRKFHQNSKIYLIIRNGNISVELLFFDFHSSGTRKVAYLVISNGKQIQKKFH
jgi:DUF971 family protein